MITLQTTMPGIGLYGPQAQQSSSAPIVEGQHLKASSADSAEAHSGHTTDTDTVSISDAGLQAAKHDVANGATQYYEQFMPTYEGFSAANISAGIADPGMETFSAGKSFDQVAIDVRASLDNNYDRLDSIGKPYNVNSARAIDRNSLVGDLDRRALQAVVSNEGGLFTKEEQTVAQSKMRQQQSLAMGLYSGQISDKDKFIDPFLGDKAEKFKAGIEFLDQVSNEEKADSIEFAYQRAGLQRAYENVVRERGGTPEDFSTDHPLVSLLFNALNSANGDLERGQTSGNIVDMDDLRRQPWFEGFTSRLDGAIRKTRDIYLENG